MLASRDILTGAVYDSNSLGLGTHHYRAIDDCSWLRNYHKTERFGRKAEYGDSTTPSPGDESLGLSGLGVDTRQPGFRAQELPRL